ncbi:unnamed protein product [Withania somnifera]
MSHKTHAIEACTHHFHSWKPFSSKTLDYDSPKILGGSNCCCGVHSKRQCRSDRITASTTSIEAAALDMSKLSLIGGGGKRRRRGGSRSVSGKSSDRSGNRRRRRCCSVGASAKTYGGLFVNGGGGGDRDMNWSLDASEVNRSLRKEKEGERESNLNVQSGNTEGLGNESGYGSEPGYRGDAEFGYGDEIDEEEDDQWGDEFGALSRMEKVGENTLHKVHHRCRRKKQDCRMVIP